MQQHRSSEPLVLAHLGPAGDHSERAVRAVPALTEAVAARAGRAAYCFGRPYRVWQQSSADHLRRARPHLERYAAALAEQLRAGHQVVTVNGRCAVSLASIPQVVAEHPDAVVVWLDAHADLNVPGSSPTDYLGGMAVSGPLGWWDTGLGSGLDTDHLVLVGARSIETAEQGLVAEHGVRVLPPSASPEQLVDAVAGRPVWFHLDCDVMRPGLFRTDYREDGGLTLEQLGGLAEAVSSTSPVVGLEVAEWEGPGTRTAEDLLDALAPLLPERA